MLPIRLRVLFYEAPLQFVALMLGQEVKDLE